MVKPETSHANAPGPEDRAGVFPGSGEMAALMSKFDWSATPLGSPQTWPPSLRTVVRILLTSRYAMWMSWGPDLTFLYNDAYGSMTLGAKHPWALGRPAHEVWSEIWPQIGPRIERVLATGEATWDERLLLFLERSGYAEETYHTFSYSPLPDDQGVIRGHLCVVTEETERVIDERRLALLKELASHLSTSRNECDVFRGSEKALATDDRDLPFSAIYLFDQDAAKLVSLTGAAPGGAIARSVPVKDLLRVWGSDGSSSLDSLQVIPSPAFADWPAGSWIRPSSQFFVTPIRQQGMSRPVGLFIAGANPFRSIDERYRSFVGLFAGQVTAAFANARAYEDERRRAEALAEVDRAKTAFFSNVSHEFRTPLTLMLGPTEDALSTQGALSGENLETVYRNQVRLLKLVNSLLDFSRIEAGGTEAHLEPVDLSELTCGLAAVFRSAIERGGLSLRVDCPPLPEAVFVDPQMWEKILLNLLSNAFKFTFEGEISVSLRQEHDRAVLRVSDTGVGIALDEQPRVFERFRRIEGAKSRTHEGTGIGLALVHELVTLLGGDIAVKSEPGRGTTFTVSLRMGTAHLPASPGRDRSKNTNGLDLAAAYVREAERWLPGPASPSDREDQVAPGAENADRTAFDEATPLILVADDNADMREYVGRLLRARWRVEAVSDGLAALDAARARTPTVVLTDVMMPGLDGFGLLRELKNDAKTRSIPVIMLSARAGDEARVDGLEAGADDYLAKPFSARELMARVGTHVALKRLARRLDRERAALTELFRQTPLPIAVMHGPDLVFEIANAAYEEAMGRPGIAGKTLLEALPEIEGQGFDKLLRQVMATNSPSIGRESRLMIERRGRIEETYWTFIYSPLVGENGISERVVVICTEVTDQVRARRLLETQAAAAEGANRAKDEFLAMLGHELRNPLAPILTAVQLMQLKDAPQVESERTIIERQTRHLVRLVDDLLDVSRIAQGKIELKRQSLEIASVVTRAIELASPLFEARDQKLEIDVETSGLAVEADPARLAQAIANLLMNAAKYTQEGGHIWIRGRRSASEVVLAVRDNGMGIAPEMLPHIFDLFVQERQALDRSQGGLGLGLAIVRNIMALHAGSVTASSEGLGHGSEFVLTIPVAPAADLELPTPPADSARASSTGGLSILVVDDNEDAAGALAAWLSMKGHTVRVAGDAVSALRGVKEFVPAVALLDVGLPGMDGYELAAHLRRDSRLVDLRLVAVTGYGQASDRERARSAGFDAHLVKPVDLDQLDLLLEGSAARSQAT